MFAVPASLDRTVFPGFLLNLVLQRDSVPERIQPNCTHNHRHTVATGQEYN